jgi:hypothetical protein
MADGADNIARAWWAATIEQFLATPLTVILGVLARHALQSHPVNHAAQLRAWQAQLGILSDALTRLPTGWRIVLEYPLLRLGRRLNAVIVSDRAIFVLEFKTLSGRFDAAARAQVLDYALDLQDFHAGSRDAMILPILVAETGNPARRQLQMAFTGAADVIEIRAAGLGALLHDLSDHLPPGRIAIDAWEHAAYRPVPTIVDAAKMLYARHGVQEIAVARADTANLTRTTRAILDAIDRAKQNGEHVIVFVTGIPGAGKTLCGLNAVFGAETGAAFLTGNLPLVHVLREALAQDSAGTSGSIRQARQKTEAAIQGLTGFVRDNVDRATPPHERVIVFDEAQRAWDAAYGAKKFNLDNSEAALFLDIMAKHRDYAAVIALVGSGQEINTGEAGLGEWGRALAKRPAWRIFAAPGVIGDPEARQRLFDTAPAGITLDTALHLDTPIRSVNSTAGAPWVDAVLRGEAKEAQDHARHGVPFYLTRSLEEMRQGLRLRARGQRRAGLVCSTGARRLVADGIWPDFPHLDAQAIANWFLKSFPADVRASDALEMPATQFACQGLELDYVGLCWGGDFVWQGKWQVRKFSGTKWQHPAGQDARAFRRNSYRVLMTRARYDTIIWVPRGDAGDATREPDLLDQTADFLLHCGATMLTNTHTKAPVAAGLLL